MDLCDAYLAAIGSLSGVIIYLMLALQRSQEARLQDLRSAANREAEIIHLAMVRTLSDAGKTSSHASDASG